MRENNYVHILSGFLHIPRHSPVPENKLAFHWPCHRWVDYPPASHSSDQGSVPEQPMWNMWNLWWTAYCCFSANSHTTKRSLSSITRDWYNGPFTAWVSWGPISLYSKNKEQVAPSTFRTYGGRPRLKYRPTCIKGFNEFHPSLLEQYVEPKVMGMPSQGFMKQKLYPSLLSNGYRGLFPRSTKLTTHLQLVPSSRKCGSMHPFPHTPSWRSA
jgi:hypothetical protein